MRYASVCSGIEAPSVAWEPLRWTPLWFAEIEAFPSQVLAHRFPSVPNLGDMTTIRSRVLSREVEAPDVLVGGCPCQAFSVAGLRRSLDDSRGNLTLEFVLLADAIDEVRARDGKPPAWLVYENVPGLLSVKDNAFGCLLGGLVGSESALEPSGKWSRAGVVAGPSRTAAWRVLDAQYFGLAQRRARVFVLARGGAGNWDAPDALLPIIQGGEWHPAPCRAPRQGAPADAQDGARVDGGVAATLRATDGGADVDHARGGALVPVAGTLGAHGSGGFDNDLDRNGALIPEVAGCLQERDAKGSDSSTKPGHLIPCAVPIQDGRDLDKGQNGLGIGAANDPAYTIDTTGAQAVAMEVADDFGCTAMSPCLHPMLRWVHSPVCRAMTTAANQIMSEAERAFLEPLPFDTTQVTHPANYSNPQPGDPCHPLAAAGHAPAIAQSVAIPVDYRNALRVDGATGVGTPGTGVGEEGDPAHAVTAGITPAVAFSVTPMSGQGADLRAVEVDTAPAITTEEEKQIDRGTRVVQRAPAMTVRRLTPTECERLQGFPDGWTAIPDAKDGPRYRALGNSMATFVMRYLGERIDAVEAARVSSEEKVA